MSNDYTSVSELPEGCRQAVYDTLQVIADSKHLLGLRYGEWLGAPVIESSIAASAMAQDEFGHSRLFYTLVDKFQQAGFPPRQEVPGAYRNIEVLDKPFEQWQDFIAANTLIDTALWVQLQAFETSRFVPLRRLVPKLMQEETFHIQHATGWVTRMAQANERTKSALEKALKRLWHGVLSWFGPQGSPNERVLLEFGIQDTDNDGLRARWVERLGPLFDHGQLDLPVSCDAITGEWLLSTELNWDGWDDQFRRFSRTGPDRDTFAQIEHFSKHDYPVGTS